MAATDGWRLSLISRYAGQMLVNTLHFKQLALVGDLTQAVAQVIADQVKEAIRPEQSASLTYETWVARAIRGGGVVRDPANCTISGGAQFEGALTGVLTGGGAGDGLPPQDAMVVGVLSASSGRSRRGRLYMGGMAESSQANGLWLAAAQTNVQGRFNILLTQAPHFSGGALADFNWIVWSETLASGCKPAIAHPHARVNVQAGAPATAHADVVAFAVRDAVRSQRRRQIGAGN